MGTVLYRLTSASKFSILFQILMNVKPSGMIVMSLVPVLTQMDPMNVFARMVLLVMARLVKV